MSACQRRLPAGTLCGVSTGQHSRKLLAVPTDPGSSMVQEAPAGEPVGQNTKRHCLNMIASCRHDCYIALFAHCVSVLQLHDYLGA